MGVIDFLKALFPLPKPLPYNYKSLANFISKRIRIKDNEMEAKAQMFELIDEFEGKKREAYKKFLNSEGWKKVYEYLK